MGGRPPKISRAPSATPARDTPLPTSQESMASEASQCIELRCSNFLRSMDHKFCRKLST